jgi:hypothetical protein
LLQPQWSRFRVRRRLQQAGARLHQPASPAPSAGDHDLLIARIALRTKTAESIAQLSGGEFFHFHDAKDLKAGLVAVSNDVPNYYVLSFRPTTPTPGLHALHVETKGPPRLVLTSGREYWIDDDTTR